MAVDQVDVQRKWTIISQQVASPAAGSDWSIGVPVGQIWRVRAIFAQFATNSTVASRLPIIKIKDASGNLLYQATVASSQSASTTNLVTAYPLAANALLNNNYGVPIPPEMTLPEGATISTTTNQIQTGDQWSAISLLIEQGQAL